MTALRRGGSDPIPRLTHRVARAPKIVGELFPLVLVKLRHEEFFKCLDPRRESCHDPIAVPGEEKQYSTTILGVGFSSHKTGLE
jgi:hypothetical protein